MSSNLVSYWFPSSENPLKAVELLLSYSAIRKRGISTGSTEGKWLQWLLVFSRHGSIDFFLLVYYAQLPSHFY